MALSTAVFVGEAKKWIPELVERSKKLKVNAGTHSDFELLLQMHSYYISFNTESYFSERF